MPCPSYSRVSRGGIGREGSNRLTHQPTPDTRDCGRVQIPRALLNRLSVAGFADELNRLLSDPNEGEGPDATVVFLQRLVRARVLDRVAARAAYLTTAGRLDPRDLKEVLPHWHLSGQCQGVELLEQSDERPPALAAGDPIGRSVIEGLLCSSRHGDVYRATHSGLGCPVVVKIAVQGQAADQLRTEVVALAEIAHRNVVRLWDTGTFGGFPFLATQHHAPGSLKDELARRGRIQPRPALRMACDAARGLRATLAAGFVHGDVKPGNLLLDSDGTVKVADFGLARRVGCEEAVASDRVDGSWPYLAPERFGGFGDHRADVYALGLTVYHLLTGVPPVAARTHREGLRAHRELSLEPLHWSVPGVSRAASSLLLKMVARDPADRPANYDELVADVCRASDEAADSHAHESEGYTP